MVAVGRSKKPNLMVVTAGSAQIPLVRKAKALGYEVLATDINANAPALTLADHSAIVDASNQVELLRIARAFQPHAIVTEQSDAAVASVAAVAAELGLPGISPSAAVRATDKWHLRESCRRAGIKTHAYRLATSKCEAIKAAREIGLPVIIKPTDNQASRGVTKVYCEADLPPAALRGLAASRSGRLMVEELLSGQECTVESFVANGKVHVLAISERTVCRPPFSYGLQQVYPAEYAEPMVDALWRLNDSAIRAVGITMGFAHAEMIITRDGARLIEIAARGCGARVATELLPRMTGVDLLALRLQQATGEAVVLPEARENRAGMIRFFELPDGIVHGVDGIGDAAALQGVIHVEFSPRLGSRVVAPVSGDERPGYILAVAPTRPEVVAVMQKAMSLVKIEIA